MMRAANRSEQSGGANQLAAMASQPTTALSGAPQSFSKSAKTTTNSGNSTSTASNSITSSSNNSTNQSKEEQATGKTATRLVFGLSSRTNRLKHDEYAEKRSGSPNQIGADTTKTQIPPIVAERKNMSENGGPIVKQRATISGPKANNSNNCSPTSNPNSSTKTDNAKIRASKYGNYYKPQDIADASTQRVAPANVSGDGKQVTEDNQPVKATAKQRTGKSPDRTAKIGRRKSLTSLTADQKHPPQPALPTPQPPAPAPVAKDGPKQAKANDRHQGKRNKSEQQEESAKPSLSPRMQFNIPPPPKVSCSPSKSSVVSYAKSRIYDKPTRQILSNPLQPLAGGSLLDSGTIPESILSGFKPPKQVIVSQAREKWEGGEPFTKCKSRQRLAAQAGKKLLHGTWSMTSVVATQQLQLQQALANSSSSLRNQINESSVKILTRGSVLERVQQFEKVPVSVGVYLSPSSSSSSLSSDSGSDDGHPNVRSSTSALETEANKQRTNGVGTDEAAGQQAREAAPTSKQALYKTRVSSIQISAATSNDPLNMLTASTPKCSPQSPSGSVSPSIVGARKFSFGRRRSSTASNSSQSSIPRFYHPNGKPNTYEIELQKKNIVACFDKFPERKALLTGPMCKRHFHSIALACGFSEYFKEPLLLYVKHQMTKSNLLHNTGNSTAALSVGRKQSGVGFAMTNGTSGGFNSSNTTSDGSKLQQQPQPQLKQLARAASIDNSTMEKIQSQNYITCEQFLVCWRNIISSAFDNAARFVHLLTLGQRNHLLPDDFVPLIQSIIDDHPGLRFLRAAPDFHMRYIQTVIARIYFCINKSWTGKISLSELRHSNLLAVLQVLSQEDDINQITDYFSYEHFYVIYCKFWNLDQDHDLLISKEDLARHNDAAISSRIIERIFMGIVSKQIQKTGKMSYTDFVWFLLAEEDKKHPRSVEYWFRLMDIDGDGYISMYEMEYFYYEQMKRLELMNIEALPFLDSACQILDLVNPKGQNKISLSDLKRTKLATIFFDTFINLEKYLEHESREFVSTRDVVQDGVVISDWDRYASEEYESLVTEESSV